MLLWQSLSHADRQTGLYGCSCPGLALSPLTHPALLCALGPMPDARETSHTQDPHIQPIISSAQYPLSCNNLREITIPFLCPSDKEKTVLTL